MLSKGSAFAWCPASVRQGRVTVTVMVFGAFVGIAFVKFGPGQNIVLKLVSLQETSAEIRVANKMAESKP